MATTSASWMTPPETAAVLARRYASAWSAAVAAVVLTVDSLMLRHLPPRAACSPWDMPDFIRTGLDMLTTHENLTNLCEDDN